MEQEFQMHGYGVDLCSQNKLGSAINHELKYFAPTILTV